MFGNSSLIYVPDFPCGANLKIDLTTGNETYPAGRFLEIEPNATSIYEIDFNRAFFPYCYYNPTYECPISPPENHLQIPIRAGERLKT